MPRQRCGPGPSQAGAVAVLTPAGPRRGDEAEPLSRAAAAATRPPGGCSSAGGRVAPAAVSAPAPASAAREAATGGAERAYGARQQGAGKVGWGPQARVGAVGEGSSREDRAAVVRVRTESVRRSGSSEEERGVGRDGEVEIKIVTFQSLTSGVDKEESLCCSGSYQLEQITFLLLLKVFERFQFVSC